MKTGSIKKISGMILAAAFFAAFIGSSFPKIYVKSASNEAATDKHEEAEIAKTGGGYAASGQIPEVGFASVLYDATNGLPTSDANCVFSESDGYIWIGGYSGILQYDGDCFTRLDASSGLVNGRVIYEDKNNRIWVGTNDNGIVILDDEETIHITDEDGLPSSSIRGFGESNDKKMWVGTTDGVVYIDEEYRVHPIDDNRLDNQYIIRMTTDTDCKVYGNTRNGDAFCIFAGEVTEYISGKDMGIGGITTIYADQKHPGYVYLGGPGNKVYYGPFGKRITRYNEYPVAPLEGINWITEACDRIWVNSDTQIGYFDENKIFHVLTDIPLNSSIEMMVPDYQGNLWFCSTRQGVMKIVSSNFRNLTDISHQQKDVVNSTCIRDDELYIGTDSGLQIIDANEQIVENELTDYLKGTRIRCIVCDEDNNLWICTYTDDKGLIYYSKDNIIKCYTEGVGLSSNEVRCAATTDDRSVLVGTNGGVSVIKDGRVKKTYGENEGLTNTVILTIEEGDNNTILAGTDGGGIFEITRNGINRINRKNGLTSDVVLKIKWDEKHGVYWIITSNSIQYMKEGKIKNVDTFPFNNICDVYSDDNDILWVLSAYGVFTVKVREMLDNNVTDYRLSTIENGLTSVPTDNAYSTLSDSGILYISGRSGVCSVNVNNFFDQSSQIKIGVRSITINGEEIMPDANGDYVLPSNLGRVQISAAILDYSMANPLVHMYLDGAGDSGITATQNKLSALEYTGLKYGNYNLHIQIISPSSGDIYQEKVFRIVKKPHFVELTIIRILLAVALSIIVGFIVWRVMTGTVIRRQYEQIRAARDEAERANLAKSRFLANISHEIRTPINTIMGMDEMIMREDPTDVPKPYFLSMINYATDIRSATESLLNLINDLLDISKIESGKMHLVETEYDTIELIRSIVTMIRVRSEQKDLTFEINIDEKLPRKLYGDSGKIKQIILNLLTNAVKYTDEGGFTLKVLVAEMTEATCSIKISVKDTGIGVKAEDVDKLFTAYERLDEEKNKAIQGTGLGLDISRRFAELMNGQLWCESVYGKGSEFIFTLNQKIVDPEGIGKFIEHEEKAISGPYIPQFIAPDAEILVVDDNPMNLNVIKGLLKATRMFVTTASSGEECLEKIKYGSFNLVLLDHMMPGMDGIETLEHIRETHPDLPVYALTANAAAGGSAFYKSKGFDGYLPKPVDSVELEKAIMKHLPPEIMMKPEVNEAYVETEEFPEDKRWLNDVEGISSLFGIKNSGGITAFINSITLFYDTIDSNAEVIEKAYNSNDIRLFTVKVHALKSSCRIVGAMELSALAEKLENAGNKGDIEFINENTSTLLSDYRAYKEKLKGLGANETEDDSSKEFIPEDELMGAYEALKELVPQMDYDGVEMVLYELKNYKLPDGDKEKIAELEKLLKTFSWDEMEKLLG
ncbi:hybrid sensor histidine kinase/response regulator [Butyrivibrio sp. AE3004]|uniref:hybrid sensor histidine kinase/response regulator n=1 Tax=Butyrivibrio sp. AE3004 TaxID=1506994 RepID=UPI000494C936|nr:ATP-binding protein [Butyrivibrio sp. AE3004]